MADDTDIAVMLLYHWKEELGDIIFFQERQQKGSSIKQAAERHCDTVSASCGKGKPSFLKQVNKNEELKDVSITIMNDAWAVQGEVSKSSQIIFNITYSGKQSESLIKLR